MSDLQDQLRRAAEHCSTMGCTPCRAAIDEARTALASALARAEKAEGERDKFRLLAENAERAWSDDADCAHVRAYSIKATLFVDDMEGEFDRWCKNCGALRSAEDPTIWQKTRIVRKFIATLTRARSAEDDLAAAIATIKREEARTATVHSKACQFRSERDAARREVEALIAGLREMLSGYENGEDGGYALLSYVRGYLEDHDAALRGEGEET